ncbi:tripartite tricarboxylate transporter substrate binding protein [soil metagenome]
MRLVDKALAGIGLALLTFAASAQAPAHSLKIVVPFPPGGTQDLVARALAAPLQTLLNRNVIVENRAGAGGVVAAGYVARAEPDGDTVLLINPGPAAIAPAMNKVPYDPIKDFAPVTQVANLPFVLVTSTKFDAKDLTALIAAAKSNPGKLEYASAGIGSSGHLMGELFSQTAGVSLLHIPYQGQGPSVTAVVAGEVKMSFTSPSPALFEMVRAGRMRMMAVSTPQPSRLVPGAPTLASAMPGFSVESWYGVVAPAKTAPEIVRALDAAIQKVIAQPDFARSLEALGCEPAIGVTSAQFGELMAAEVKRWGQVVKSAKLEGAN